MPAGSYHVANYGSMCMTSNASLESNVVDVFIGLLRKKIEKTGKPRLLHTRRGRGNMLAEEGGGHEFDPADCGCFWG